MKLDKTIGDALRDVQSSSESFDANLEARGNRKNRKKGKKIIHNCCVLVKKENGDQEIVIKQFLFSSRLKTTKCIAKKAK